MENSPLGLQSVAERESLLLAPYAMHSVASAGRRYPEAPQEYRGPYQRDRDRILHCSAFRRLSGKMHTVAVNNSAMTRNARACATPRLHPSPPSGGLIIAPIGDTTGL